MTNEREDLDAVFAEVLAPLCADVRDLLIAGLVCFGLALGCVVALVLCKFGSQLSDIFSGGVGSLFTYSSVKLGEVRLHRREVANARGAWALAQGKPKEERERLLRELIDRGRNTK